MLAYANRCVFIEMKTRKSPFRMCETETQIIDEIFKLCGNPTDKLHDKYAQYPDWEKYQFSVHNVSRIRTRYEQ